MCRGISFAIGVNDVVAPVGDAQVVWPPTLVDSFVIAVGCARNNLYGTA